MDNNNRSGDFDGLLKELHERVTDEKAELIERLNQKIEEAKLTLRQIKKWSIVDPHMINECLLDFSLKRAEQIIRLAHYLLSIEKTIAAIEKIPDDSMEKEIILRAIKRAESAKEIEDFFAQKRIQEFFVAHGISFQNDENSIHWSNEHLVNH